MAAPPYAQNEKNPDVAKSTPFATPGFSGAGVVLMDNLAGIIRQIA
jgi:hypothetical protein